MLCHPRQLFSIADSLVCLQEQMRNYVKYYRWKKAHSGPLFKLFWKKYCRGAHVQSNEYKYSKLSSLTLHFNTCHLCGIATFITGLTFGLTGFTPVNIQHVSTMRLIIRLHPRHHWCRNSGYITHKNHIFAFSVCNLQLISTNTLTIKCHLRRHWCRHSGYITLKSHIVTFGYILILCYLDN